MTENLLDAIIVLTHDEELQLYRVRCEVWDGPHSVASKTWENTQAVNLILQTVPFVLYWSRLYFDNPSLTPKIKKTHGLDQLPIFPEDTQ
jgi:hypothetical protein